MYSQRSHQERVLTISLFLGLLYGMGDLGRPLVFSEGTHWGSVGPSWCFQMLCWSGHCLWSPPSLVPSGLPVLTPIPQPPLWWHPVLLCCLYSGIGSENQMLLVLWFSTESDFDPSLGAWAMSVDIFDCPNLWRGFLCWHLVGRGQGCFENILHCIE